MPKDGRKKYHPNFKKKTTHPFKNSFFPFFFWFRKKKKKKHPPTKKTRFRSRKTSSFATTGWWPRSLEVMDFFSWKIPEVKRERREGHLPRFWSAHLGWFFFVFRSSGFFLVGTSEKKKHLEIGKRASEKNEENIFLHVEFLWQVFQGNLSVCDVCAVFLWWRKRKGGCIPARYHKKTVGIHG